MNTKSYWIRVCGPGGLNHSIFERIYILIEKRREEAKAMVNLHHITLPQNNHHKYYMQYMQRQKDKIQYTRNVSQLILPRHNAIKTIEK